jgi:hypothetical protein
MSQNIQDVHFNHLSHDIILVRFFRFQDIIVSCGSRDNLVGISTDYGLDDPVGSIMFSSQRRPDLLWDPPNILSNKYWGLFHRE